jgi:hypothetical protein
MRIGLRAVIWLTGLLLSVGMWAQTVPTTNEVRAMRGLGPVEGSGLSAQGSGEEENASGPKGPSE